MRFSGTLRVTGIRSQNPRSFGGAIFTGVPIAADGNVVDAREYFVVRATSAVMGGTRVERGQWIRVNGPVAERRLSVSGYEMTERQVEAEAVEMAHPSGEHIVAFLAENPAFEGIGTVKARRLWERFGEGLYERLEAADVESLAQVLSDDLARSLVGAWASQGESRTIQWIHVQGFDVGLGRKIVAFFGAEAKAKVEEDPYRLLSFCADWETVDRLATTQFEVGLDDRRRLQGAVEEGCYRLFGRGNTVMLTTELVDVVLPLLGKGSPGVRWRDLVSSILSIGLSNGSFVVGHHGLQPLGALVMERQVARAVADRLCSDLGPLVPGNEVEALIDAYGQAHGVELNPEQRSAVHAAAMHSFLCVTGGAGVGKTTVLKAIYDLYDLAGVQIIQVALAGRAAQRMQEATGRPSATIASFLRTYRSDDLGAASVLVIDEASMVDIISMSRICEVLPKHVRLLLVGDSHQLMPVGPGLILHAIQQVPQVPVIELKTVKRYGSEIAAAANAVRAGKWPALTSDETARVSFIPCRPDLIAETVLELFALEPRTTKVLCSVRNGASGTKALNAASQERFAGTQPAAKVWNREFACEEHTGLRLGDVILCTRNLWAIGLQNGSLGVIYEVTPLFPMLSDAADDQPVVVAWVDWDDGVRRPLTIDMLDDVELGYAITVHKAQGSQWQRVIIPVTDSRLLDRTLLYTAITRAESQVILVGDENAARRATLAPTKASMRNVGLDLTLVAMLASAPASASASAEGLNFSSNTAL